MMKRKSSRITLAAVLVVVLIIVLLTLRSRKITVQMVRPPPASASSYSVGLIGLINETDPKMHCCRILNTFTVTLEQLCKADGSIQLKVIAKRAEAQRCTCLDFFYCKLVVVTALSSNHYDEAQDMIASMQKFLPSTKLIVYDLGLSSKQKRQLHQYCNIEVRPFVFSKYPSHTRNLLTYAWKTFIVNEIISDYEVIFWGDASARVMEPFFAEKVFPFLLRFPFVARSGVPYPIVSLTHNGMLQYLNLSLSRKEMGYFGHLQAGCWVMWANSLMRTRFINYWVDCAAHQECISPLGSKVRHCNFKLCDRKKGYGVYIGCHRYDQSAMAMILIREFGLRIWNLTVHSETRGLFYLERKGITHQIIKICSSGA